MRGRGEGAFAHTLAQVAGSLTYHVESGPAASAEHRVTAVEPVALAPGSPGCVITPPPYVNPAVYPEQTLQSFTDLSALQYSRVRLQFRFTRPAESARLELTAKGAEGQAGKSWPVPVALSADRTGATAELPALAVGGYALVLHTEAEHHIGSTHELPPLSIWADAPPVFTERPRIAGLKDTEARKDWAVTADAVGDHLKPVHAYDTSRARQVTPDDVLRLKVAVEDKVGVARAEVEYRVNDGAAQYETIFDAKGTPSASAEYLFKLAGKVKDGDVVFYRVRAADNRRLAAAALRDALGRPAPAKDLEPHLIYFPEKIQGKDRWFMLKVNPRAESLQKQEVVAAHDEVNRRIEAIRQRLQAERGQVGKARAEARTQPELTDEQAQEVGKIRRENTGVRDDLKDLAREASETPALQPVAERARELAVGEMERSDRALRRAQDRKEEAPARERQLEKSDRELAAALQKLDELQRFNDRLGQDRLDQLRIEQLAKNEAELGKRAADLAAKHPNDPKAQAEANNLRAEQEKLAQELRQLTEQSKAFKDALESVKAEQTANLAEKARELAQAERDLSQAEAQTRHKQAEGILAEFARKQQKLAEEAGKLAEKTARPEQATRAAPLRTQDAHAAAEALKQGRPEEALHRQDQAARELDRAANDLERGSRSERDPKEEARRLAQAQAKIEKRLTDEAARVAVKTPQELLQALKEIRRDQGDVHEAASRLLLPPQAENQRREAVRHAAEAAQALDRADPLRAHEEMQQARQALERLANQMPAGERKGQPLEQLARVQQAQREVMVQADRALRELAREDPASPQTRAKLADRLQEAVRRQAQAAEALAQVNAPKQLEARQEKAQRALQEALEDLLEARPLDVHASQEQAQRELDRLRRGLQTGERPVEEKARLLARAQKDLADHAARLAANPQASPAEAKQIQEQQQHIAREAGHITPGEAPLHRAEVAATVRAAEEAARANPRSPATAQKMAAAARALEKVADQLEGKEPPTARADRLAKEQAKVAAEAEHAPANPARQRLSPQALQKQRLIAQELRQMRAGEDAQAEKKRALEALVRAEQPGPQQVQAQRQAADALRDLANRMADRQDPAAKVAELAREQRDLAEEVRNNPTPEAPRPGQKPDSLERLAKKTAGRQAELARQVERAAPPQAAPQARQEALNKMQAAQRALDQAHNPAEAKEAVAQAAQAAEKLAGELGKQQAAANHPAGEHTAARPAGQSPRQAAEQLARQQQALAQATQQAAQRGGEAARQALQAEAKQQARLNQEAAALPAGKAAPAYAQARQAMNQAKQALERGDAGQAQQKQQEAAGALQRLAQALPGQTPQQAQTQPDPAAQAARAEAGEARQLAQAQRDLRAELQKALAAPPPAAQNNPVAELARRQQAIAREAGELARDVGQHQGQQAAPTQHAQQAAQAAQQAARQVQAGALPQAQKAGQQAAQQFRQLAGQMAQTPRAEGEPRGGPDPAQRAAGLAQRQEEVARQMQALAGNAAAQRAQQQARQEELRQQTGELTRSLAQMAQSPQAPPQARGAALQAAMAGERARGAMQQAQAANQQGQPGQAQQAQQQAAQQLDAAAQQAAWAAGQMAAQAPKGGTPAAEASHQAGQALHQAQGQMSQAQNQLAQSQPQAAQGSMQQAAQSLQQAAQALARQMGQQAQRLGTPSQDNKVSSAKGAAGGGTPDEKLFGKDGMKYLGKTWGQLPGELRTRILQDMRARYGEDYAVIIQRYFEQIADTNRK
jgi:hypothetical protein